MKDNESPTVTVLDDDLFINILKQYYGYSSFRSIQLDIIRSIASGHDTLGLMPTGGGKSITFQVPALSMEGVCIVVTPLISLMKDQVMHLKEKGIKAEYIHSGLNRQEIIKILDNAIYGAVKFLYISPERISQKLFIAKLYYMKVCFITVDEAHCISQWGYDFRPAYLNIKKIREEKKDVPVLALTATATSFVIDDIKEKLEFGKYLSPDTNVFRMSFQRSNISYVVRHSDNKDDELIHILNSVPGSAIVYTRNRENTKAISRTLNQAGIMSDFYHAGLDFAIKDKRQQLWHDNEIRVIVATNAFGMGIDKADVRLVIHVDCPDSIEAYYQEAGRAGRDGLKSYAVLLYNRQDRSNLLRHSTNQFPEKDYIRKVYDHLAYFFELAIESGEGARYEFNEQNFCQQFKHNSQKLEGALSVLQKAGYLHYEHDPDNKPRVMIMLQREELYHLENISPTEDAVLTKLLRYYGSLFTELTYFDENMLSNKCDITPEDLHVALKMLAQKRIIRYVPRRHIPIITYLQQRIDSERLRFNKDIYEVLQERLAERIESVLKYAESTDECRERMLMDYFGESSKEDCGHCDYCLETKRLQRSSSQRDNDVKPYRERIMSLLGDHLPHSIGELSQQNVPETILFQIIEELRNDERITLDGSLISLS